MSVKVDLVNGRIEEWLVATTWEVTDEGDLKVRTVIETTPHLLAVIARGQWVCARYDTSNSDPRTEET